MLAFLMMLAASAASTAGTATNPENAILAEVSGCLGSFSVKLPKASAVGEIPPGLIEGVRVSVVAITGGANKAFAYEGLRPQVMSCGVAIYGSIGKKLRQRLIDVISSSGKYKPQTIDVYDLTKQFQDVDEYYWGDPHAPSMIGVAMLTRKPSAQAPTIEIQYHEVMVQ
jgi:hypothetical protein